MADTSSDRDTGRPGAAGGHSGVVAGRSGGHPAEWADAVDAVDRFAAWLAEFSPYYRGLRTPIQVPDDAPARLAYFWRTVGWTPGIGLGWYGGGFPPVREVGRAEADRAFRRWLGPECFAPAMGLAEPTGRALWDRLPERCWVLHASVETHHSRGARCHGGSLFYVDEDAGDDPPLMRWATSDAGHDTGPVSPRAAAESSLAYLMGSTLGGIAGECGIRRTLPAPAGPGLFAPVFPHFWRLAEGVWGMPDPMYGGLTGILAETGAAPSIGVIVYRSARVYLDFLADLPAEMADLGGHLAGAHTIEVRDAKELSPRLLAERGFTYVERENESTAAGRLDGVPVVACQSRYRGDSGGATFTVAGEDYPAFRDLLAGQRTEVVEHTWREPARWWAEPSEDARTRMARLVERAERAAGRALAGPATARPDRAIPTAATEPKPEPAVVAEATVVAEAAVRAEAAALREWVLAASPGLELTVPEFDDDEPALVRALWQELGYSGEFEELIGWPGRASSERALAEMLAEYRARGGYELDRASLPKRLRLVWIDGDNDSNLLVTDEDTAADDPPLLCVDAEDGGAEVDEEFPTYTAYVGEQIAWYAGEGQATWNVRTTPPLSALGTQLYPRLAPKIRHLGAPGVWASPGAGAGTIGARRFRDLIGWIAETTIVDRLELCGSYGPRDPAARIRLTGFTAPSGLREWRAPNGPARCYAGLVDDVPILVEVADRITLYTPHADRARAEAVAAAAGWL